MWSLILYFLFGIGQPSNSLSISEETTVQAYGGHHGGETETPLPPRPKP